MLLDSVYIIIFIHDANWTDNKYKSVSAVIVEVCMCIYYVTLLIPEIGWFYSWWVA